MVRPTFWITPIAQTSCQLWRNDHLVLQLVRTTIVPKICENAYVSFRALVMELAEGGSLADLITSTKTSVSGQGVQMGEVLEMTGQLTSALGYIHGQGIVHRDIKADNILLAHTNGAGPLCVKLADFGVAAVLATVAGSNLLSKVGTLDYFSPERGKDMAYGAMTDMWALGCVLIELVTLTRLQRGLWNDGTEVVERRNHLLGQVKLRDESVGKLVEGLLQMDKR
jgi:serine/threonine protein kinase